MAARPPDLKEQSMSEWIPVRVQAWRPVTTLEPGDVIVQDDHQVTTDIRVAAIEHDEAAKVVRVASRGGAVTEFPAHAVVCVAR